MELVCSITEFNKNTQRDFFDFVWQKDKAHPVSTEFRLKSLFLKSFEIDKFTIKTGKHTSTGTSSQCK